MDTLEVSPMRWKIGQAKQRFSEVVRRAAREPQLICNRDRVVAGVVDAESLVRLQALREREHQRSFAEAFEGLRALAKSERYTLRTPPRRNRRNTFAHGLTRPAR
jgi:prevent-host-death family protein